jgi:hypothetical protein
VTFRVGRDLARRLRVKLRLEPRSVKEFDKGEREHYQKKDDARHQNDDRKGAPRIALKGYVAETERAHHGQGPVKPRDPRKTPAFGVKHYQMKKDREDDDDRDEKKQVLEKRIDVFTKAALA